MAKLTADPFPDLRRRALFADAPVSAGRPDDDVERVNADAIRKRRGDLERRLNAGLRIGQAVLAREEEGGETEREVMPVEDRRRSIHATVESRPTADEKPAVGRKRGRPVADKPWEREGVSRMTWYRRRAKAKDGAKA